MIVLTSMTKAAMLSMSSGVVSAFWQNELDLIALSDSATSDFAEKLSVEDLAQVRESIRFAEGMQYAKQAAIDAETATGFFACSLPDAVVAWVKS